MPVGLMTLGFVESIGLGELLILFFTFLLPAMWVSYDASHQKLPGGWLWAWIPVFLGPLGFVIYLIARAVLRSLRKAE